MTDTQLLPLGDSYHQLACEFRNKLAGQSVIKRYAKGDVLLQQGDEQDAGYLIISGVLGALHASSQGAQKCKEFYFQDEFSLLYGNWLTKTPALYQLKVIRDAELIKVPLALLDSADWQAIKHQLISQQLLFKEAKEAFLLLNTPEQRYQYLLEQKPHWLEQLSLNEVAMYLGISAISLSRIRRRLNLS
ncbi:cyclic nucleotide-binding protein [Pseudoalteromonas sp. S4488]|uniref:Crp/Fnr family transcriptional regulator n=1 Tax=unclassified Pseudoalteromonas TaxID=194690 RepID=UPI00110987AA|nr:MULTISPECIES: Crp/Fnr family transcriptional regulator [unclassified Pseudoalteromonas]TMO37108.1 cyclic nucleotide-binding protein [Pseudoalteromonas sp. S4491]TMO40154.1 cyclic nucleotide-binding protein [Pseudoalteromonas sp. S4488]